MATDHQNEMGDNAQGQLQGFAERINRLEEQKAALVADIKAEYEAAGNAGLSPKALRKAIKELGLEEDKRQLNLEFEWEVDAYRKVLGLPTKEDLEVKAAIERIREMGTDVEISGPGLEAPLKIEGKKRRGKKHLEVVE